MSGVVDLSPSNLGSSLWFIEVAFHMMYSACKLNSPFPILNQAVVPFPVLTVAFWQVLSRQVRWFGSPISNNFPQFVVMHTVKGFSIGSEAEVDVFLESLCFLFHPTSVGNLISGSSIFSESTLYIWKLLVHILLTPLLKDWALPC